MIELAPQHKTGLTLTSPLIAGGGVFGFSDEYASLIDFSKFGALITNPLTLKPRTPAAKQKVVPFAGGALLHTGLPNAGVAATIKECEKKWARMACAVIVHVACEAVADLELCLEKLEQVESVAGIEIGFREEEETVNVEALIKAAARVGGKPVIIQVPRSRATLIARSAERANVQAISLALPRGTVKHEGEWVSGRLYGAAWLPQTIYLVRELKMHTALPIIGAGGVHNNDEVEVLLAAGASAVQLDSAVWTTQRFNVED